MAVIGFVIGTAHDLLRLMSNFLNSHRSERESEVGRVDEAPNVGQTGRSTAPQTALTRSPRRYFGSTSIVQFRPTLHNRVRLRLPRAASSMTCSASHAEGELLTVICSMHAALHLLTFYTFILIISLCFFSL